VTVIAAIDAMLLLAENPQHSDFSKLQQFLMRYFHGFLFFVCQQKHSNESDDFFALFG